jgi:hypothetical protein
MAKGIIGLDLMLSAAVFLILIVFAAGIWLQVNSSAQTNAVYQNLERKALLISDLLVESQGVPNGWESNASAVQVIGLASTDHELDAEKVASFKAIADSNYETAKQILGIEGDDFYFKITDLNSAEIVSGGNMSAGTEQRIVIQRRVLYNDDYAILEFGLW